MKRQYLVYLRNGAVLEESASKIIVRNDCLHNNLICFMRDNGYSSLSQSDIRAVYEYRQYAGVEYINLADVTSMDTNEFCAFLKGGIS